jgi:hypothetical protein
LIYFDIWGKCIVCCHHVEADNRILINCLITRMMIPATSQGHISFGIDDITKVVEPPRLEPDENISRELEILFDLSLIPASWDRLGEFRSRLYINGESAGASGKEKAVLTVDVYMEMESIDEVSMHGLDLVSEPTRRGKIA